ncbi:MAG: hypothetical protein ACXWUK_04920 [Burkholderiales bacterium]
MKLVSFEVETQLGRFERIGALAHGAVVDLNAACTAYFAQSEDETSTSQGNLVVCGNREEGACDPDA